MTMSRSAERTGLKVVLSLAGGIFGLDYVAPAEAQECASELLNMNPKLKAAYSFYGTAPDEQAKVANISCPVYGFYAGNDERVNATIPTAQELMRRAGKKYEPVVYGGAGHGFMREGEKPDANEGNRRARDEAWARWKTLLKQL